MSATLLWWGRFDPDYSRNRILRSLLKDNGIGLRDFRPRSSLLGSLEAAIRRPQPGDALWLPCFRHRDFRSARNYANRHDLKLVFDPLISSWDKAVYERRKYPATHYRARRLLQQERSLFSQADIVIADTRAHADFFIEELGAAAERTRVIPVGAEEALFTRQPPRSPSAAPEILFFGSFIGLQGPQHIVEAARLVPDARWTLLGEGPLRSHCESLARDLANIGFEDWLPYERLPERIAQADVLLGIFGDSPKAGRVIPNKVYQALACGRPVVTRISPAYPDALLTSRASGLVFTAPADPASLATAVSTLISDSTELSAVADQASRTYTEYFSLTHTEQALLDVLVALGL